jgi:hypothetical protein
MNDAELDQLLDQWKIPEPSPAMRAELLAALQQPLRRRFFGVPVRWIAVLAAAAGLAAIGASFNGSLGESGGSVELPAGRIYVRSQLVVDPPVAILRWWRTGFGSSVGPASTSALHGSNYFEDRSARRFYGFEYVAEPLGGGQYKVTINSLQPATVQKGPFAAAGEPTPLPSVPEPRIVSDGQSIDTDIYRGAGERIYVRLRISASAEPVHSQSPGPQPNHLSTSNSKIYKNGVLLANTEGKASGACIWFRLPGEDRYLITLDPTGNPAFVAAGQLSGRMLEFQSGTDTYRLESAETLAAGSPRRIYVFHDNAFESLLKPGYSRPMVGSAGPACILNGACLPH